MIDAYDQVDLTLAIINETTIHISTTRRQPVADAILPIDYKVDVPCIQIHMLDVPMQESLATVVSLTDILYRQVRQRDWLWGGRTHLQLSSKV